MAKFDPKAIAKQIRSAQNQIAKGLRSNEEQAVSDVLKLLQKFQREIRSAMGRIDSESFNAVQMKRMESLIDAAIADFRARAGLVVQQRTTIAAKTGEDYWRKTASIYGDQSLVAPVLSDQMLSVLTNISTELIKGLSDEIASKTKAVIQRAVLGTQTPFQAMKQISQVVGERGQSGAFYSAERIVRTEMARAYNGADKLIGNQIADSRPEDLPKLQKAWMTANDDRVRDTHAAAHKQVVDYDEKFVVGGEKLDWSVVDPNGSPGNNINCRCFIVVSPSDTMEETLSLFP